MVASNPPLPVPPLLWEAVPQFNSINIETRFQSADYIYRCLRTLFISKSPNVTSELSVCQFRNPLDRATSSPFPQDYESVEYEMPSEHRNQFTSFIASLSVLRLSNTNIHWDKIEFSEKLVSIHLQSVVLGDHFDLNKFLKALESAPELRDMRLISVDAYMARYQRDHEWGFLAKPVKIALPSLQSLVLKDLTFNVLECVLISIPPGSHDLEVRLTPRNQDVYLSPGDTNSDGGGQSVFELLNKANIHTLSLKPSALNRTSFRRDYDNLRSLLQSLPSLKALILDSWELSDRAILGLARADSDAHFAELEELYILGNSMWDPGYLSEAIDSHPLQKLALDSRSNAFKLAGDKAGELVELLREDAPDFRSVRGMEEMVEFNYPTWCL